MVTARAMLLACCLFVGCSAERAIEFCGTGSPAPLLVIVTDCEPGADSTFSIWGVVRDTTNGLIEPVVGTVSAHPPWVEVEAGRRQRHHAVIEWPNGSFRIDGVRADEGVFATETGGWGVGWREEASDLISAYCQ